MGGTRQGIVPDLRTARLRLRPYRRDDFETLFRELVLDPEVTRLWDDYRDPALTEADRWAMAERDLGSWIEEAMDAGLPTWVAEAADASIGAPGEFVGAAGIYPPGTSFGPEPEVGCMLASRHHRRGLATETLTAIMEDASTRLGVPTLAGVLDEANVASIRLVERLGFVLERTFEDEAGRPFRRYLRRA